MHFFSILLFVFSCSMDNFVVGLSYGIKKIRIDFFNNLIVALISGAGTLFSMLIGKFLCHYISARTSTFIGSIILILFGIYFILGSFRPRPTEEIAAHGMDDKKLRMEYYDEILKHPELADKDNSKSIDIRESIVLGVALSINNVGLGIGASIVGINPYISSILSLMFSLIFVQFGYYIGDNYFSKLFSKYAQPISGLIIILLGIYEFFI